MIKEKLDKIKKGELSAEQNVLQFLKVIQEKDKEINAFLAVNENAAEEAKKLDDKIRKGEKVGKLAGLAIAIKSNINVIGLQTSCASKTLEDYKATYDADVIEKIKAEDGIIIGMVNMDEFASGISGETSAFGKTLNPTDKERVPGGSSSGSAAAVAANMCDIALGSDTGGSIRNPASHCGVIGIKPSYGRVSRYGLIDLAMSFDQIGPLCKDLYGCALMMEVIAGKSEYDTTTYNKPVDDYANFSDQKLKIGIVKGAKELCKKKEIYDLVEKKIKQISDDPIEIEIKHLKLAVQTYYPIVYTEFFSGTRKFDGRKYGKKIEENCGEEVLRRILGGREISLAEHHGKYYKKALQVQKMIIKEFEEAFKKVDVIILPVTPDIPHKIGEEIDVNTAYAMDAFTTPANLAGICAGTVNAGKIDNTPIGVQVLAKSFNEKTLFDSLHMLSK